MTEIAIANLIWFGIGFATCALLWAVCALSRGSHVEPRPAAPPRIDVDWVLIHTGSAIPRRGRAAPVEEAPRPH